MNKLICPHCGCDFMHIVEINSVSLVTTAWCDDCEKTSEILVTIENY